MKITRWHSRYPLPSIHEFPDERYPYAKENYGPHRSTPGNNRSRFKHISNDRVLDSRLNFSEEGKKRGKKKERRRRKERKKPRQVRRKYLPNFHRLGEKKRKEKKRRRKNHFSRGRKLFTLPRDATRENAFKNGG